MIQLNDYTTDDLEKLLAHEAAQVPKRLEWLRSASKPIDRCRLFVSLQHYWRTIGILTFVLRRDVAETRRLFQKSVSSCKELFEIGVLPGASNPVMLADGIELALIGGDRTTAAALASLRQYEPTRYDQDQFIADEIVMAYIAALLAMVRSDQSKAKDLATAAARVVADNCLDSTKRFGAQSEALLAILNQDSVAFQTAMERLLSWQEKESREGQLRENPEGLICISGLALVQLARNAGLTVSMNDPYAPLDLLAE